MTTKSKSRVDLTTGELLCPRCAEVKPGDLEAAEAEIRRLRRKVKSLERDKEAERQAAPNRKLVLALIERWKRVTNHPKSNANAADRFDLITARLKEGYSPQDIELAIDGIGAYPFVVKAVRTKTGPPNCRHDRLGIALGSGEKLEAFANLGAKARRNGAA